MVLYGPNGDGSVNKKLGTFYEVVVLVDGINGRVILVDNLNC